MALGGWCLAMKDLAQALPAVMIRGAVDSFRGAGRFVRFAGYLVGLALLKGVFSVLVASSFIGASAISNSTCATTCFAHLIASPRVLTPARAPATSWRAPPNDLNAVRMMLVRAFL